MKLNLIAMLVLLAFLFEACGTTYELTPTPREDHPWLEKRYRTYAEFLADAEDESLEIFTTDRRFVGRVIRADADSIGWRAKYDSTVHLLPISEVQRVVITHHYNLWWLGGLVGLAGTMYVTGAWEPHGDPGRDYGVRPGAVLEVIGGTAVGAIVGGTLYHTNQYLTGTNGSADTTQSRPHD